VTRTGTDRFEWLRAAAATGAVHTVRASFADRLGHWRGKRIPAGHFVEHPGHTIGFCDGMLVCDVRCDVIDDTPYTNYGTGYPDFDVRFDLARLRPVGWIDGEAYVFGDPYDHDGRPSPVSPRHVLQHVLRRLDAHRIKARVGFELGGRFMHDPLRPALIPAGGLQPGDDEIGALTRLGRGLQSSEIPITAIAGGPEAGAFRLALEADEPLTSAEAVVVAKGAAKEIARQSGVTASFMTIQRHAAQPSMLELTVDLDAAKPVSLKAEAIRSRLVEVRALLQPSANAFKMGLPAVPIFDVDGPRVRIDGLAASSEADPFTVAAAVLAAIGMALGPDGAAASTSEPDTLAASATQLARIAWPGDWLGVAFVANSIPLLLREDALQRSNVTDWEIERYWSTA
jgi:glutamine synthetase